MTQIAISGVNGGGGREVSESCWESNMTRMPWINSEFETGDTIGIRFLLSSQGLCSLPQLFSALFFDKVEKYQSPLLLVIYLVLD